MYDFSSAMLKVRPRADLKREIAYWTRHIGEGEPRHSPEHIKWCKRRVYYIRKWMRPKQEEKRSAATSGSGATKNKLVELLRRFMTDGEYDAAGNYTLAADQPDLWGGEAGSLVPALVNDVEEALRQRRNS